MSTGRINLVVLGLSLSSAWGNGHATTYRALLRAFVSRGHRVLFLERDVPWYAPHRDFEPDFCDFRLYKTLAELDGFADRITGADAVMVGSFVPDGIEVGAWVQKTTAGVTAFYDIDTPVTLAKLDSGSCEYLAPRLIPGYDLYLSFAGGRSLARLEQGYGARAARPLYCSVDAELYKSPFVPIRWDLSYLGTYSPDRQGKIESLLLETARRMPQSRFCVAGAQYPRDLRWPGNVEYIEHVPPCDHPAFYAASRFTLNVTRADMVAAGHSPSVRLFEAAACGTPVISDVWEGIDEVLAPGKEIVLAESTEDVMRALAAPSSVQRALGKAARKRALAAHTSRHRAAELEQLLRTAMAVKAVERSPRPEHAVKTRSDRQSRQEVAHGA